MLRKTTMGTVTGTPVTSNRLMVGTKTIIGEGGATALPAVEQMGQKCESIDLEFNSRQQCICAARKTTPTRSTRR